MRRLRVPALWIIVLSFVVAGCTSRPNSRIAEVSKASKEKAADTIQARQDFLMARESEGKLEERAKVETPASMSPLLSRAGALSEPG